ncbi:MAG: ABC transporter ATP-binding protein [Bdellovibrionota bacterium]
MTSVLEVKNLSRRFGNLQAVDGLSFDVKPGEIFGLLGPNGAGKTTTFHLLTGLLAPDAGEFFLNGKKADPTDGRSRVSVGVAFQKPSVDGKLTGRENLEMGAALYALPQTLAKEKIKIALERSGLAARAGEAVEKYSGGMRRRLELERVLLSDPKLLILDEPTQGLDQSAFRSFWDVILALRKERGMTVLLTTHDPREAEFCDRIAVLDKGRLLVCDTPEKLRAKVGGEVIVVEAERAGELSGEIASRFSVSPVVSGDQISFEKEKAHELVPRIVESFPVGRIRSVQVHRPTLADVFLKITGRGLEQETTEAAA